MSNNLQKRIAFYGGSFDPVHIGHLEIARTLIGEFDLDEFCFVPAYHAPHKRENKPASPFHRFAMLSAVTDSEESLTVSTVELDDPDHPYSIETLGKLKDLHADDRLYFVIGADSWEEITTWRRWEEVLTAVDIIVVTRPGFEIGFDHVTDEIRERIADLRSQQTGDRRRAKDELRRRDTTAAKGEAGERTKAQPSSLSPHHSSVGPQSSRSIFITDSVFIEVSATGIRRMVREGSGDWKAGVPEAAARHIEKYGLYR